MSADIQKLVGKIMTDEAFVQALVDNPEQALREAGIKPDRELLDALKGIDVASLKSMAASFGDDQAAV